jgi:hypothetical protein
MLLSQQRLRQILGVLWLIDGLLQLQPQMFTLNMINGVMAPIAQGQPGPIAGNLQLIISVVTHNLILINLLIAGVQILIGVLLITGFWVRGTVVISIIWALVVWYGGEGMSMLFTGQGSILSGAPGAVLLYPIIGLLVYPRDISAGSSSKSANSADENGLISRLQFRWIFAGFWIFCGLLQLQPFWWQPEQISQAIGAMVGAGGLNVFLVDPVLTGLAHSTTSLEIPLNILLIVICLGLGVGFALVKEEYLRPVLIASLIVSVLIWYVAQGFGMIFTGMATDFNSGLLLVVMTLACWPGAAAVRAARRRFSREMRQQVKEKQQTSPA